ncbi:MAG TPA: sn-glycerol-3-phosphate ABC transporter substrate-binding protein UgpB [Burkholderiales bacterium]|nr:sn-glycerol-3-phosphate ABC transporter substrate-binding protein UgpB [Burkholderiales bacterium]
MKKLLLVLLCAVAPAHAAQEVRLWHAMSGPLGVELDRLVARFNASQKDYRVVSFFHGPYDAVLADDIELRRGTPRSPHIVQVQDAATADMMHSGAALPLWRLMPEREARYLPAVSAYFSDEEGRLLALPFNISTPVLYYNRDAFREAKLDPDKPPRTWYEVPPILGALVQSGRACALTTTWPSWVLMETMSAWHNQAFATHHNGMADGPVRLAFNTRLMVRWISMLSSWQKSGYFSYSGRNDEAEARFAAGECAVLTASSASFHRLREAAQFDFGVAQLPYYDDFDGAPQNTLAGGSGLWVIAGLPAAEYKGVARFLAYLSSIDVQAFWHQRTGFVPITAAAYELSRRQGFYRGHPEQEIAVRQLLQKQPTDESKGIRLGELRRIRGIIHEELEAVWSGAKPPLEALNTAVQRGNLLLDGAAQR